MKTILSLALCSVLLFGAATAGEAPLREARKNNIYSTYRITVFRAERRAGSATGFAVSDHDVVSAGHVAAGDKYTLDLFDEDGFLTSTIALALVRFIDPEIEPNKDLALFHTEQKLPFHIDAKYGTADVGEWIYSVGGPYGEIPYCVNWGVLAAKTSTDFPGLWLATINTAPGNSGGPVFNRKGELIGVLVRGAPSITLFVPAKTLKEFLEQKAK